MGKGLPTALGWAVAILVAACRSAGPDPDPTPSAEAVRAWIDDGRFSDAERLARAWLNEVEAARGVDSLDTAAALDLLVESLWKGGKSSEPDTRILAERAASLKETADPVSLPLAVSLTNLAIVIEESGKYAEAQRLYERALDIRRHHLHDNHIDVADSLYNLGIALMLNGDYVGARSRFEQALEIHRHVNGPPLVRARVLNSLGSVFILTGDYELARETHEKALLVRRANLREGHPTVAGSLHNLAAALSRLGMNTEAVLHYEEALAIRLKALGPDHPLVASSLNNLGNVLDKLGDHDRATELYRQAVTNLEKSLGPHHPTLAMALDTLADRVFLTGNFEEAARLYRRALAIQERALGPDHPFVGDRLEALARVRRAQGDTAAAFDIALRSVAVSRDHLLLTARTLSERQALEYSAQRARGLGLALSICRDDVDRTCAERIWNVVIRSRALVLDEMAARHRVSNRVEDPRVAALAEDLEAARTELAQIFFRGADADRKSYKRDLSTARRNKERLEHLLAEESVGYREALARERAGLDEVRQRLPAGSALIAFFIYRYTEAGMQDAKGVARYLALTAAPGDSPLSILDIGSVEEIDSLVRDWQRESAREGAAGAERAVEDEYRVAAEALRKRIWDPVARLIGHVDAAFLVPDGALQLVSFATLPTESDRYLVETGPRLHYLSTERDLLIQHVVGGQGLLALGDPAFGTPATPVSESTVAAVARCESLRTARFQALDGLREEVDQVVALWRNAPDPVVTRLTGEEASEAALKRHAPGSRVLHLATHGFFIGASCSGKPTHRGMSGMTGPAKEVPVDPDAVANPLLLSGLALAGANLRHERDPGDHDGILTAEELSSLDLQGTEWVVLSACDTGIGEVLAGEGVFGLRRAFQVAGARTLIMSLWSVDDDATTRWMAHLYRLRLERGLSTSRAVRQASLNVMEERRGAGLSTHPFYWGGFVAVGDWS